KVGQSTSSNDDDTNVTSGSTSSPDNAYPEDGLGADDEPNDPYAGAAPGGVVYDEDGNPVLLAAGLGISATYHEGGKISGEGFVEGKGGVTLTAQIDNGGNFGLKIDRGPLETTAGTSGFGFSYGPAGVQFDPSKPSLAPTVQLNLPQPTTQP